MSKLSLRLVETSCAGMTDHLKAICQAELHRYEAHGIKAREFTIKRILSYAND